MSYKFDISQDEDLIRVRVFGTLDGVAIKRLWAAVVEACDSHNCYDILGVSDLDTPFSTMDAYDHHEIWAEVGVTLHHRIAWVNKDAESRDVLEFTETVLLNRCQLNGGLFPSIGEAEKWLRERPDARN